MTPTGYVGRFAPSPTGELHAGSLVAALASWLDARAHGGRWLVRIEDLDRPRCSAAAAETILRQLAACGLLPDEPPVWQSERDGRYEMASMRLLASGWAFVCGCSRSDIASTWAARGVLRPRGGEWIYPGTCRTGLHGKLARTLRLRATRSSQAAPSLATSADALVIDWHDRRLGAQRQDVSADAGDFVLKRADGLWAYQLAVVVDDAEQGISDVVRGEDLADNTPRQIHLQRLLGLPTPRYLHTPLVLGDDGEKLSKQNGATALELDDPLAALQRAAAVLDVRASGGSLPLWLAAAVEVWRDRLAHDLNRRPAAGPSPSLPPNRAGWHDARTISDSRTTKGSR